jgi:hypothetical protein
VGRKQRPSGKCHLCGCVGELSWEHVPPESAYNDRRIVRAKQQQMLVPGPWDGQNGDVLQRGSGAFTLCEPCNNKTGKWYGKEYAEWAKQAFEILQRIGASNDKRFSARFQGHPLRFIKQVVTMFFSVNTDSFAETHPELVKFVLDRNSTGLSAAYSIDLVLVRGPFARSSGFYSSANISKGAIETASEIAHIPFGLRLILGSKPSERSGPIERFANYSFNEFKEVWVETSAGHVATKFPGDYRSRAQVDSDSLQG